MNVVGRVWAIAILEIAKTVTYVLFAGSKDQNEGNFLYLVNAVVALLLINYYFFLKRSKLGIMV